jgi:hypothetical protein
MFLFPKSKNAKKISSVKLGHHSPAFLGLVFRLVFISFVFANLAQSAESSKFPQSSPMRH